MAEVLFRGKRKLMMDVEVKMNMIEQGSGIP